MPVAIHTVAVAVIISSFAISLPFPVKNENNAVKNSVQKWPDAMIPYEYSNNLSVEQRYVIESAMEAFHNSTCIRFIQRTNQVDYIIIGRGNSCESFVGRKGGCQRVILTDKCLLTRVKVQHELMHTVGFHHEHSRPDRDDYIIINRDNLDDDNYNRNYKRDDSYQLLGTPYDTRSIMHYKWNAGALDKSIATIIAKDGSQVGPSDTFTQTDVLDLNRLYECDPNDCWHKNKCEDELEGQAREEYPTGKYKLFLLWLWLILKAFIRFFSA